MNSGRFSLGTRYRVVSISMDPGFRFHPKALLLSGPKKATLLVGSGNLTYGGWRENGEIWLSFETGTDGTGPFAAFRAYLGQVLRRVPLKDSIEAAVSEAFDPDTRDWATDLGEPSHLLGRVGDGIPLLEMMVKVAAGPTPEQLYVAAPYFDHEAHAPRALHGRIGSKRTTLLIQSKRSNLRAAAANFGPEFEMRTARFVHAGETVSHLPHGEREAFLHAKLYAVGRGDQILLLAGSANCSQAALTIPGSAGNAELMVAAPLSRTEFEESVLKELVIDHSDPVLLGEPEGSVVVEEPPSPVQVLAARLEAGHVRVAFKAGVGVSVTGARVDGTLTSFFEFGEKEALFPAGGHAREVVLLGVCGGTPIQSSPHWIDHESELRVSARGRSVAAAIEEHVREETWGIGAWTSILTEISRNLDYMPQRIVRRGAEARRPATGDVPIEYSWSDVFTSGYGGGGRGSIFHATSPGGVRDIAGLRALLLRWYGIGTAQDGFHDGWTPDAEEEVNEDDDREMDRDLVVDRPVRLPVTTRTRAVSPPSDKDLEAASTVVRQVAARMSHPKYLRDRSPAHLAADLKIASLLLRCGLTSGWMTQEEFCEATTNIWSALFFGYAEGETEGWIEHRLGCAEDRKSFVAEIASIELAASLGGWVLTLPERIGSSQHARVVLASYLSLARLPWLWMVDRGEEVLRAVVSWLDRTAGSRTVSPQETETRWLRLIDSGFLLSRLQDAVRDLLPAEQRSRIGRTRLAAGELLLQPKYGF